MFDARNATTSVKADRADIDRVLRRTGVLWLLLLHPALAMLPPMSLKELVNLHLTPIVVSLRARYADLKDTLTADPGRSGADPLSSSVSEGDQHGSEGPSWDRYFLDTQLKTTINQDVTRTFQDMPFFREAATQKTLDQVLFVWSRQHGEVGYRQGMHEVAAVVLWVLHNDRLVSPATDEVFSDELEKNAWQALESNTSADIEADCHTIFSLIMKLLLLPFYMHKAPASFGDNKATPVVTPQTSPNRKPTPLLSTSARIFHNLLQPTDPQLYQTLVTCGVEEQVWGVRWLRLLFSREIPPDGVDEDADDGRRTQSILKKVVEMWTAIFAASGLGDGAEEVGRQVLEWTAVEMLVAVRDKGGLEFGSESARVQRSDSFYPQCSPTHETQRRRYKPSFVTLHRLRWTPSTLLVLFLERSSGSPPFSLQPPFQDHHPHKRTCRNHHKKPEAPPLEPTKLRRSPSVPKLPP